MRIDRDLDLLGVKHEANDTLVRDGTELGYLVVYRVRLLNRLLRLCHQIHMLLAPLGDLAVLSLDRLPQPVKHVVPDFDGADEVADGTHHGLDGVVVAHVTERDDLLTRLACVLTRHARVGVDRRGTGDVGAGQDGGAIVVFAKTEVESSCALEVGVLEGCDGETESGGEGLSQVGDFIEEGVEREELGAGDGTSDYRLDKGHLDVGEASPGEDLFDGSGSGNGGIVEEGVGLHTDGENERAERLGLPGVGVGEGVDGRPLQANGIEVLVDALSDRAPSGPNSVTVDRASLTFDALGLRAVADGPVRARLEDTGGAAGIKVTVGVGVLISEAGLRHGDDVVRGHPLELAGREGSQGDECVGLVAGLLDG